MKALDLKHHGKHRLGRMSAAVLLMGGLGIASPSQIPEMLAQEASADDNDSQDVELLFVQTAEDLRVDSTASTLTLVNVNQQTLYFSDRPVRIAGHIKMDDYLKEWTMGEDNFGQNPPNASLSVYEPAQAENTVVVVELRQPVVDGTDLVYTYKLIDGTMPTGGGATALFIDKIGVGGGVGVGYHGVGVGRRGPGP